MILNTVRGAAQILLRHRDTFERTPKFGISKKNDAWTRRRYQLHVDAIVPFEIAFALYNLGTAVFATSQGNWGIAIYASIFFLGLMFTSGLTVVQALEVFIQNRKLREPTGPVGLRNVHRRRFVQD
jgi:hypothetical protein